MDGNTRHTGTFVALAGSMAAGAMLLRRGREPADPAEDLPAEFEVWRVPPQRIAADVVRARAAVPPAEPSVLVDEPAVAPPAPPAGEAPPAQEPPAPPPPPGRGPFGLPPRRRLALVATLAALAAAVGIVVALVEHERTGPLPSATASPAAPATPGTPADSRFVARDLAAQAGVAWSGPTAGESCVLDYDGDGVDDLFLTGGSGAALYAGRADGRFTRMTATTFPPRSRQGCATADFNGDGRLDIYAAVGECATPCAWRHELWIQQPDARFVDRAEHFGLASAVGQGRAPVRLDADGDDRHDLFTGEAGGDGIAPRTSLWVQRRAGFGFIEQEGLPGASIAVGCATAGDVDEDGDDELVVCGGGGDGYFLRAYENRGGRWSDATKRLGLPAFGRADAELGHMDGDGRLDLILVGPRALEIRLNRDGRFPRSDFSLPLQAGRDIAIADADGDGNRDIYVVQGRNGQVADLLLLNRGGGKAFSRVPNVPQARSGEGDTVQAIPDYRGTRRAGFLVSNGHGSKKGPRMLVQLTPRR